MPALAGAEKTEVLPYRFTQNSIAHFEKTLFFSRADRLTDLHGDPPDPPPKLAFLS